MSRKKRKMCKKNLRIFSGLEYFKYLRKMLKKTLGKYAKK